MESGLGTFRLVRRIRKPVSPSFAARGFHLLKYQPYTECSVDTIFDGK